MLLQGCSSEEENVYQGIDEEPQKGDIPCQSIEQAIQLSGQFITQRPTQRNRLHTETASEKQDPL